MYVCIYDSLSSHPTQLNQEMENGAERWNFLGDRKLKATSGTTTVHGVLLNIRIDVDKDDPRPIVPLGHGDPSLFPCFRTTTIAEDAIVDAVRSAEFNYYSPKPGLLPTRR